MRRAMTIWDELDPIRMMEQFRREMDRVFEGWLGTESTTYPAFNVWADDNTAIVTAEIPGVDPQTLDVSVRQDVLHVSGERKPEDVGDKKVSYHRRERPYGKFARSIRLPFEVDPNGVKARYTNGVLRIELPRSEASKPKRIAIESS